MAEITNVSKLIINYLTEEQYQTAKASGLINENELYFTDVQDSTTLDCFEELFTATAGQTLFTLTEGTYQTGQSRLTICVNGAQQPSTAYIETSSSSFTFKSGLSVGDSVIARYLNSRITSNITLQAHKASHASAGSDPLTPSDIGAAASTHIHGNIANGGTIGSTPSLPIFTGTNGLLETKSIEDAKTLLGVSAGLLPQIIVTIDTGSSVSCTDGITTLNATSNGTCTFNVPNYGTWTITATLEEKSTSGSVVVDTVKKYAISLAYYKIYGFTINEAESNPTTSVTYTDESTAFTKGSSAWDTSPLFVNIKPCLFKDGAVVGYLQRNDYTKFEDGTSADITSGTAGDVMVEIPKMAYYVEKSGDTITCKVLIGADAKSFDSRYSYLPFSRASEGDRDKIYIGAYLGYAVSDKLRSLSEKAPTATTKIGAFRTLARANGTGYQQLSFYPMTLLQILYVIKYGSLNSQTALGRGFVDGNSAKTNTGGTNSKGFCYGETTGTLQMKMFGIEDFWGNLSEFIDGAVFDSSWNFVTAFKDFNNTGSDYPFSASSGFSSDPSGWLSKSIGSTQMGFLFKNMAGSSNTYYADNADGKAGGIAVFGGNWASASYSGIFAQSFWNLSSYAYANTGARLCYI